MIGCMEEEEDRNGETFMVYYVKPSGMKWIAQNYKRLNLKVASRPAKETKIINDLDDIPF
jgi:hypothetical protein